MSASLDASFPLVDTAATLELGTLFAWTVQCAISREMVNHLPLYKLEQLVKDELTENEEAIRIAEQQANEQRIRDEEARWQRKRGDGRLQKVAVAEGTADSRTQTTDSVFLRCSMETRTEPANTISENRHAMAAASLSSIAGMHSWGV